jgi:hypothetical protein
MKKRKEKTIKIPKSAIMWVAQRAVRHSCGQLQLVKIIGSCSTVPVPALGCHKGRPSAWEIGSVLYNSFPRNHTGRISSCASTLLKMMLN